MSALEITLLVIGAVIFVLSFMLPEREAQNDVNLEEELELIKNLVAREVDSIKDTVNGATDGTIEYAMGTAERALEKISNEKIMAINEYAGTVLEEINKNHNEAVFLYDMLKEKHTEVTNVVNKADASIRDLNNASANAVAAASAASSAKSDDFVYMSSRDIEKEESETEVYDELSEVVGSIGNLSDSDSSTLFESVMSESNITSEVRDFGNNNEKILELHKQGMSTVNIAKELKLGVGEVKLVIDLFQ